MFDIKEQLKKLPERPGVYLMKDKKGNIIYVGKSKVLKNRVTSYFRGFNSHAPKVQTMVVNIKEFEYIVTDTEMEALILEQTLIKKYQPRFNIALKDDKQYPYIKVTISEDFPRVFMTRKIYKDKNLYFGPYTNVYAVKKALESIHKVYPIRKCNKKLKKSGDRPCLNFHIKQCIGPCKGDVNKEAYRAYIDEIILILQGKQESFVNFLDTKMKEEAMKLNFEKAAEYRDLIVGMKSLTEKQKVISTPDVNQDVIALYSYEDRTCIMIFYVRDGKIFGRDQYIIEETKDLEQPDLVYDFMAQYYSGVEKFPKDILVSIAPTDNELIEEWLDIRANHKVNLTVPKIGEKKKLVKMVADNAKEYLTNFETKIDDDLKKKNDIKKMLEEKLGLDDIYRIEAYDISNIYGVFSVGSMVVYENYKKKSSDYRRFKVKTIEGSNDYGSMQEVLFRRFSRGIEEREKYEKNGMNLDQKFNLFPDVLFIDGGVGHVNSVLDILNALKLYIPVVGMVKDDKHRTDKLYYDGDFIEIKDTPELYRFVYAIQEEVHRFAIDHHKSLRTKGMTSSILDDIDGVGTIRRKNLMIKFKTIEKIKNASIEELVETEGINESVAKKIIEYFKMVETTSKMD
ncbi:MAG: excinuclease ABC subunit UvrC [Acidaminobacteraceae bacterium]